MYSNNLCYAIKLQCQSLCQTSTLLTYLEGHQACEYHSLDVALTHYSWSARYPSHEVGSTRAPLLMNQSWHPARRDQHRPAG